MQPDQRMLQNRHGYSRQERSPALKMKAEKPVADFTWDVRKSTRELLLFTRQGNVKSQKKKKM